MERRMTYTGVVLAFFTLFYLMDGALFAAGNVKANGILTAVESDGSVVIDEKGYEMARSAEVLDQEGKRTFLKLFTLPAKVDFEYEFTKNGPLIIRIKEIPKVVPQ